MDSKTLQTLRRDAEDICRSAIEASVPDAAIQRALAQLPPCQGRTVLVSIGKAGWQTAKAAYDALGSAIEQGVVVTKYGHSQGPIGGLSIYEAGHPVPDEHSVRATEAALAAGVSRPTLYRWTHIQGFPDVRVGGNTRIPDRAFESWLATDNFTADGKQKSSLESWRETRV